MQADDTVSLLDESACVEAIKGGLCRHIRLSRRGKKRKILEETAGSCNRPSMSEKEKKNDGK